jgi:hypothetical protein
MNLTNIDLEALSEAAAYRELALQCVSTLAIMLAVYLIAKREEAKNE